MVDTLYNYFVCIPCKKIITEQGFIQHGEKKICSPVFSESASAPMKNIKCPTCGKNEFEYLNPAVIGKGL